jgi:hypothetical protein
MTTTTHADRLWRRMVDALTERKIISAESESLTPAEIAVIARRAGEDRVRSFVDGFYYPERYGQRTGRMNADAAEELVAAVEQGLKREAIAEGSAETGPAAVDLCSVCGRRPAAPAGLA